jgi:uncharacterized protein (TIGR02246 family)
LPPTIAKPGGFKQRSTSQARLAQQETPTRRGGEAMTGLPMFNPETYTLSLLYARAVDRRDPAILAQIFTEDGQFVWGEMVVNGREEIARVATETAKKLFSQTMHYMVNHLAELDGDTGTAETYCQAQHISHDAALPMHQTWFIRYVDDLARVDGRWLIKRRELLVEFNTRQGVWMGAS